MLRCRYVTRREVVAAARANNVVLRSKSDSLGREIGLDPLRFSHDGCSHRTRRYGCFRANVGQRRSGGSLTNRNGGICDHNAVLRSTSTILPAPYYRLFVSGKA